MNRLIRHIEYLTLHNDCVVVPGLGALVSRFVPACYDGSRDVVNAPFRELSFNAGIRYDDGLLASSVSRSERVSYADAVRIVADEVSVLKAQLELDGQFTLGSLGRFVNREGLVEFECDADRLRLQEIELCPLDAVEEPENDSEENVVPMLSRFTSTASRIAAAVAILLVVGLTLLNPTRVGEGVLKASLLPEICAGFDYSGVADDTSVSDIDLSEDDGLISEDLTSDEEEPNTEADSAAAAEDSGSADVAQPDGAVLTEPGIADADYYFIVASLPSQALAEQFIADNALTGCGILYSDSRYRVWIKRGATYSEAMDADVLDRFPDAWVYRNK